MKIIYVGVGEEPREMNIENDLEVMRKLVGGDLDGRCTSKGIRQIFNKNKESLPKNSFGAYGPFFLTRENPLNLIDNEEEECHSVVMRIGKTDVIWLIEEFGDDDFKTMRFASREEMWLHFNPHEYN
jgi:hypothetical protein